MSCQIDGLLLSRRNTSYSKSKDLEPGSRCEKQGIYLSLLISLRERYLKLSGEQKWFKQKSMLDVGKITRPQSVQCKVRGLAHIVVMLHRAHY